MVLVVVVSMLERHKVRTFFSNRDGSILPVAVLFFTVILGMGALAVDGTRGYLLRDQFQVVADAAALAGASVVSDDPITANSVAVEFANKNGPAAYGNVVDTSDVEIGTWNSDTHTFTAGGADPNAVQVTASMLQADGNGMQTAFASLFGLNTFDVTASAVAAQLPSQADGLPMAIRGPGFGDVDPDIPEKPGPSEPANGSDFEIGEEIILFYFGKGSGSPVHLVLDVEAAGCSCDIKDIFSGLEPPFSMQSGDEYTVVGQGTGNGGFGRRLENRVALAADHPDRTVIVAVADLTADSRNVSGELTGNVAIVDFVAVHLDQIVEEDVPHPDGGTFTVRRLMATIVQANAGSGGPGSARLVN